MAERWVGYRLDTQDHLLESTWCDQVNARYIIPNAKYITYKYTVSNTKYSAQVQNTKGLAEPSVQSNE